MKEAQEPIRITKHNESTSQGVDKLEDELKKLRAVSKKQDFDLSILKKNIEKTQEKEKVLTADLDQNQNDAKNLAQSKRQSQHYKQDLDQRNKDIQDQNETILNEINAAKAEKKKVELRMKSVKKQLNEQT